MRSRVHLCNAGPKPPTPTPAGCADGSLYIYNLPEGILRHCFPASMPAAITALVDLGPPVDAHLKVALSPRRTPTF